MAINPLKTLLVTLLVCALVVSPMMTIEASPLNHHRELRKVPSNCDPGYYLICTPNGECKCCPDGTLPSGC
ncbi:hypothetical protein JCGZ_26954 [Jatropha curcas]|uniref:Uncharacterized protein n=1 Tax=Jatropha curcas TaxID=180498 RepID=A0A067L0F1_JATCU|nr:hypothetical protein JCGZ_26954 [Jatropha curcas]